MSDLNLVVVTGRVERDPVIRVVDNKTQVGLTLRLIEDGPAGQTFNLFVNVESYGQIAEQVRDLRAGASVILFGKIKWRKYRTAQGEEKSGLCVLAREVRILAAAVPSPTLSTTTRADSHEEADTDGLA